MCLRKADAAMPVPPLVEVGGVGGVGGVLGGGDLLGNGAEATGGMIPEVQADRGEATGDACCRCERRPKPPVVQTGADPVCRIGHAGRARQL